MARSLKYSITAILILLNGLLYSQVDNDSPEIPEYVNYFLILYTDSGDYDKVNEFLKYGVNPNITTGDGVSPLMFASQNGYYSIAKLLIKYGADVNASPSDGNTALHAAVRSNNDSIAELLLDFGAEANAKNYMGVTPLHYSAGFGYPFLTKLLIYFGANINSTDNQGNTPLIGAVYSGALQVTDILLQNGANVNETDSKGYSPLMIAAQYNDTILLNLLIDYGADVTHRNLNGTTALALAIRYKALESATILLKHGAANEDFSSKMGYIQLAKENGLHPIVPILEQNNLKRSRKLQITSINLNSGFRFSSTDFMFDLGVSAIESLTHIQSSINYSFRPYKKIVLKETDNDFYQYWEKRRVLGMAVDKLINVKQFANENRIGFIIGIGGNYTWGRYSFPTATIIPDHFFYLSPKAGVFYNGQYFFLSTATEYSKRKDYWSNSLFFSLNLGIKINTNKTKISPKRISWIY